MVNLSKFVRPSSVSIYARKPEVFGRLITFVLNNAAVSSDGVRLDLTRTFSIQHKMVATRSPVESVTIDNMRLDPRIIAVSGMLSATPLGFGGALFSTGASIARRDLKQLIKIREIQASREPVIVVLPTGDVFSSMSMSFSETHMGGLKVELAMTFEEVRIVSSRSIQAELDLDEVLAGAQSTSNLGAQPTSIVDAPTGLGVGGLGG